MNPSYLVKKVSSQVDALSTVPVYGTPEAHAPSALDNSLPTVLIATIDPQIRDGLAKLLRKLRVRSIWVDSLEKARLSLAADKVAACVCGFWLADGTCRDLLESVTADVTEIPVIIASSSDFTSEFQHHLSTLNMGAFDFITHPYHTEQSQRILELAVRAHFGSVSPRSLMTYSNGHSSSATESGLRH